MGPLAASIPVVCTVAICCCPSALRTMSTPLDNGAYRKLRAPSPGLSVPTVATSDFSGFESSDCALASAAASAAIDSLDRCMGRLRPENIKANRSVLGAAGPDPVTGPFLGVFREERLKFGLGPFVFDI